MKFVQLVSSSKLLIELVNVMSKFEVLEFKMLLSHHITSPRDGASCPSILHLPHIHASLLATMGGKDESELTEYVTLVSSDGYEFKILRSAACLAGTIKNSLDPTCELRTAQ